MIDIVGLRRVDVIQQLQILHARPSDAKTAEQIALFEKLLKEIDRQGAIESNLPPGSHEVGPEDEDRAGPEAPENSKPVG